jgi:hypothetical protein
MATNPNNNETVHCGTDISREGSVVLCCCCTPRRHGYKKRTEAPIRAPLNVVATAAKPAFSLVGSAAPEPKTAIWKPYQPKPQNENVPNICKTFYTIAF